MLAVYDGGQANASSVHQPGHRVKSIVQRARAAIAVAFGVPPAEVVFTSGGTEANNLAIIGLALANPRGRHLVTTPIEHPSVLRSVEYLERVFGFETTRVPVDGDGLVDPADIAAALRDDTTLVSVALANGEIGTVQPTAEIAQVVRDRGALFHVDAVQAAASLPLNFSDDSDSWPGPVDAVSLASHKIGGPQGAGALLVRRDLPLEPLLHGGGQENGRRSGTENAAGIAGFGAAARAMNGEVATRALEIMVSRDALIEGVLDRVRGARLTGHASERLPGHASFVVEGQSGESMLVALDAAGFAASSASACAAGKDEPSPTLLSMGYDPDLARTAIRFTLSAPLDVATVDRIVEVLRREVKNA